MKPQLAHRKPVRRLTIIATALVVASSAVARAQVGYPPAASPYVDVETTQELTAFGGWFKAHVDPAKAAPQSGPIMGVHYEWRAGGPAHLTAEFARVNSTRSLLDPGKPAATREYGNITRPLYAADFALGMALTGAKSWHHLVPELKAGGGFVSDFRSQADSGGFRFGTRFALSWGGGVRWVPGGHLQLRGDINNRLYTISYPNSYYIAPTGGTALVGPKQAKSFWTNNPAFTLGISYLFSR
ncbi:MAG TPA: hypothetical protein VF159_06395 [Gemmatimonadaceae bacterium]